MDYIKAIVKKMPLVSIVAVAGLVLRVAGVAAGISADAKSLSKPMYTAVFDLCMESFTMTGKNEPGLITDEDTTAKTESEKENEESSQAVQEEEAEKKGYISAKEEAAKEGLSLDEVILSREESSGGTYHYAETYPEELKKNVITAVDYMVADSQYLDPDDTVYEHEDEGIFAENNDYYEFRDVDESYFEDALFIGDSRTDGLYNYGLIRDRASFYALESVTIYNVFDIEIPYRTPSSEETVSLEKVLKENEFKKIYISCGLNELGVPKTSNFLEEYKSVLTRIRSLQPEAIIFIQGIIHVNINMSASDPVYNNKIIVQRNMAISTLANGHDIFFIEPNEVLCNENGDLIYEYTNDGIHLTASNYVIWHDYLSANGIVYR